MSVDSTLTQRRPGDPDVSTQPRPRITPAEYLEAERRAETKSEYYAGEAFAMAGTILIEVLSRSTARYDRGQKATHYRRLDSLQEHLLVAQDEPFVERYRRQGESNWLLTEFRGLDHKVELTSVGCTLAVTDIYEQVLES